MTARHQKAPATPGIGIHLLQLTGGVIVLLLFALLVQVGYIFGGNGLDLAYRQERIAGQVKELRTVNVVDDPVAQPQAGDPPVEQAPGEAAAIGWMYIPRLGTDWKHLIQQGTTQVILDNVGIGHYENTVMAGAVGNAGYAGHRMPSDLGYADRLEPGDVIVIQTASTWYVYTVDSSWITLPDDVGVLSQDTDGQRLITVTTCDPMVNARTAPRRLIVRGHFKYWAKTSDGVPEELHLTHEEASSVKVKLADTMRKVSLHAPVSPLLAGMCLVVWLLFNTVAWLACRGKHKPWGSSWNPVTWLWRLQGGPVVIRLISMVFLLGAVVFAMFAWVCPWLSEIVPWLSGFSASTV